MKDSETLMGIFLGGGKSLQVTKTCPVLNLYVKSQIQRYWFKNDMLERTRCF